MTSLIEWWDSISLKTKVTGVTVLLLTLGLLVSGIGTTALLRNYLIEQLDARVQAAASDWESMLGPNADPDIKDPTSPVLGDYYWALFEENGTFIRDNWVRGDQNRKPVIDVFGIDQTIALRGSVFELPSVDGGTKWRLVAMRHVSEPPHQEAQYTRVIALNTSRTEDIMANYTSIFFGFALIVIVFGAGLTRLLVASAFGPLREVERTAAEIAEGDLSQRLRGTTNNTEVGRLNRALNTMLNRIDIAFSDRARTIDQMRRFVADASHELRTPLVTVRGYAELYRMGALQNPEDLAQALDRVEKEAIRMGGLVEDLLELARFDQSKPLERTVVDILPLARDAAIDAVARDQNREVRVLEPVLRGQSATDENEIVRPSAGENPNGDPDEGELGALSSEAAVITASAAASTTLTSERSKRRNSKGDTLSTNAGPIPVQSVTGATQSSEKLAAAESRKTRGASKNWTTSVTGPMHLAGATLARLRRKPKRPDSDSAPQPVLSVETPSRAEKALVYGNEDKIRQVIVNLITNALRFTPSGSPLELAVEVDDEQSQVRLSVIDHGEGIPPQIREKIFQRFWRADTSRTRDTGGSGLGLAIVSAIVSAHSGKVWVEETPGGGATFVVSLPLHREDKVLDPSVAPAVI